MRTLLRVTVLSLALLGLLAFSVLSSSAATGKIIINGATSAKCDLPGTSFNGQTVPASTQTGSLSVGLENFGAPDVVGLWITFPDGRVYDVLSVYDLDGLYDFVEDNQTRYRMPFGEGAFSYLLTSKMPLGCHRLTVHSSARNQDVIVPFVVQAGGKPATGPATFDVHPSRITQQQQEISLEMRGFLINEDIAVWLTQPNGVVVDVGYFPNAGPNFDVRPFYVDEILPVGRHYVTAQGVRSGYIAITPLDVTAGSIGAPTRYTRIDVWHTRDTQRATFVIAGVGYGVTGTSFGGVEDISFWLTYPNGKVLGLGSATSDDRGVFEVTLYLSEQFPVGRFFITGRGNRTGQLAIAAFTLTEGNVSSGTYSVRSEPVDPTTLSASDYAALSDPLETAAPIEEVAPIEETAPVDVAPIDVAPIEAVQPIEAAPIEPIAEPEVPPAEVAPIEEIPPADAAPIAPIEDAPPAEAPPTEAAPPLLNDGGGAPVAPPSIQP